MMKIHAQPHLINNNNEQCSFVMHYPSILQMNYKPSDSGEEETKIVNWLLLYLFLCSCFWDSYTHLSVLLLHAWPSTHVVTIIINLGSSPPPIQCCSFFWNS